MEPTGPTGTTEQTEVTGTTESTGPTGTTESTGPTGPIPVDMPQAPSVLRLEDILSSVQVLQQKEQSDKSLLESIGTLSFDAIKPALVQWATSGFRNAYPIHEIFISAPPLCSDGQIRVLMDYIQFVSGKTIQDHVAALQARLPDIVVSFAYTGVSIVVVVSKAE